MYRGTTATNTFTLPFYMEIADLSAVYVSYSQNGKVVVEKALNDLSISTKENLIITVSLTQEDTLKFSEGKVKIQIRLKTTTGAAMASDVITTYANEILKDGVI